jgi:hypothetical protein
LATSGVEVSTYPAEGVLPFEDLDDEVVGRQGGAVAIRPVGLEVLEDRGLACRG